MGANQVIKYSWANQKFHYGDWKRHNLNSSRAAAFLHSKETRHPLNWDFLCIAVAFRHTKRVLCGDWACASSFTHKVKVQNRTEKGMRHLEKAWNLRPRGLVNSKRRKIFIVSGRGRHLTSNGYSNFSFLAFAWGNSFSSKKPWICSC